MSSYFPAPVFGATGPAFIHVELGPDLTVALPAIVLPMPARRSPGAPPPIGAPLRATAARRPT